MNGTPQRLQVIADKFHSKSLTTVRGIMGPDANDTKAIVMLNRIIEWNISGISMEADQRHVEIILKQLGMESCKGGDIVGVRPTLSEVEVEMSPQDVTRFRSLAARCNRLAADRLDMQFACNEVCRRMSGPCEDEWDVI